MFCVRQTFRIPWICTMKKSMHRPSGSVPYLHFIVIYANAVLASLFNGILIYLIKSTKTKIGGYSNLLLLLALFNISYAIVHALDAPFVLVKGRAWAFLPTGLLETNPSIGYPLTLVYCTFFGQSLVLLMYHFLYRYITVCRHQWLHYVHKSSNILLFVIIYLFFTSIWAFLVGWAMSGDDVRVILKEKIREELGIEAETSGMLGATFVLSSPSGLHLIPSTWIGSFLCVFFMFSSFSIMLFCAISIHRMLQKNHSQANKSYHQLQVQLFRTLLVQTLVPLALEYCACSFIFFVPMFGLPIDCEFTTLCISAYPVVEPLAVIYFVRDYRTAFKKKLIFWRDQTSSGTVQSSTQKREDVVVRENIQHMK